MLEFLGGIEWGHWSNFNFKCTIGAVTLIANFLEDSRTDRSSPPDMFLGKDVLKICSKFTEEYPCLSVIFLA